MTDSVQLDLLESLKPGPLALLGVEDIYTRADGELLVELREDKRIERKPAKSPGKLLGEYVSMWANTQPDGGLIVVGQEDSGDFSGLNSFEQTRVNSIEKAGALFCSDATVKHRRIPVRNKKGEDDFVVLLRVEYHPNRVVRDYKEDAYIRYGDEKHKLKPAEIRELEADKGQVSVELEASRLVYPDDFDMPSLREFTRKVRADKNWGVHHSEIDILVLMKLGKKASKGGFIPNIACALLFGKDPREDIPGCRIRFLRFDGDTEGTGTKFNAVKDIVIEGQVPRMIQEATKVLENQLRTFSHLDANGKFYAQREYPKEAWYEAIVNACVHRSYGNGLKNAVIFMKMFDGRLEIESPGPFPPLVNPQNFFHNPRNPMLMDAMRHLEYVVCAQEGTRRMRESMRANELPEPEFNERREGSATVLVTLRNNVHQRRAWVDTDVASLVGAALAETLSENEKRCLNFIAEHGEMSVVDASRLTETSWETAKKVLSGLVKKGVLERNARDDIARDPKAPYRLKRKSGAIGSNPIGSTTLGG